MIIDVKQKETHVQVSYTNDTGSISIVDIPLPETGYRNWQICEESDPDAHPTIKNWDGKFVKRVESKKFDDLNLHHFLQVEAPEEYRNLIHAYNKPALFSVDIETEITDDAMPNAETAPNKILSISITAPNLATVILSLKECDMDKTLAMVNEAMGEQWCKKYKFTAKHIVFGSEKEMLEFFCIKCRDIFNVIAGWNYLLYDNPYIKNRCKKLGVNYNICSPTKELDHSGVPLHRLVIDYLEFYSHRAPSDLISMKLDAVAEYELGVQKIKYEKTLRELYRDDYNRFIAYAIVDTILVQLIHKKTNKIDMNYNMAYYCSIPFKTAGKQIPQTDALIFKKFWKRGMVYANERVKNSHAHYPGAFVKEPTQHEADIVAGWDAKSLYPSTGLTLHISPDSYMGKCPKDKVDLVRSKGFVVTDRLSIYKKDKLYLFPEIWGDLRLERDIYKGAMFEIWQELLSTLENEIKNRGLEIH